MTVAIHPKMLKLLKEGDYVLCVAKEVNGAFTVIWKGIKNILAYNHFEWEPKYELFATNMFESGLLVKATTCTQRIRGNQNCVLSEHGILGSPTGLIDASKPFSMKNNFGTVHPGVSIIQKGESLPIYVADSPAVKGDIVLQPIENVRVWIQQNVESSAMISEFTSKYIEVDFTNSSKEIIMYDECQDWCLMPASQ